MRPHSLRQVRAYHRDRVVDRRVGNRLPYPARRQGPDLKDVNRDILGNAKLDVELVAAGYGLDFLNCGDKLAHARRTQRFRVVPVDHHRLAYGASGHRIGAAAVVVVIDHIIRTAGIEVAGQDDAGKSHVAQHGLDQHLLVVDFLAVLRIRRHHPIEGLADRGNGRLYAGHRHE